MARGRFITIEGVEGAGKSTQVRLLAAALAAAGTAVTVTREPGGTPSAEAIRRLLVNPTAEPWSPLTEALLHYAARRQHLDHAVMPNLESGGWVVCDRFADSTMAYQGYGQGLDKDFIATLHAAVIGTLAPDLTLILDLDAAVGLARAQQRSHARDRYERMDLDFHRRVRDGFLEIARNAPQRCAVVDASQPPAEVHRTMMDIVHARLNCKLNPISC